MDYLCYSTSLLLQINQTGIQRKATRELKDLETMSDQELLKRLENLEFLAWRIKDDGEP